MEQEKKPTPTLCIFQIIDQYALAYNNMDTEFFTCKLTNGKTTELNEQDHEFEINEFCDDREAYWKKRGWHVIEKDGKKVLTPIV